MIGNKLATHQENLILNGDFSQGEEHWRLNAPVEIRDGYCYASGGGSADQSDVKLKPGTYRLSFEGLFLDETKSYVNVALEMSNLRLQLFVRPGADYVTYSVGFSVPKPSHGDVDLLSVMLIGQGAGGKFRNVKLVLDEA
ncbi:hypothetical protein [Pseudomonas sp. BGI-2]|uniref:hypothetical protein n=1 Tax=Pseudomonas sp. BGI-2 TaxID=2528211 RepID=UPI0010330FC4|nr:hypothetical protein [Pseudomonas sp. BGI-2]TBN42414.1 hypothetical protein EYC95_17915 [Pseudomonas sp. BGI-2]